MNEKSLSPESSDFAEAINAEEIEVKSLRETWDQTLAQLNKVDPEKVLGLAVIVMYNDTSLMPEGLDPTDIFGTISAFGAPDNGGHAMHLINSLKQTGVVARQHMVDKATAQAVKVANGEMEMEEATYAEALSKAVFSSLGAQRPGGATLIIPGGDDDEA